MRFYFKDYDGNEVLTPTFTQYDSGQVIYVTDVAYDPAVYTGGPAFHFWNKNSEEVLFAGATPLDGGQLGDPSTVYQCALPNVLMGEGLPFFAAFYLANETPDKPACTVGIIRITMEQRPEPGFDLNYDNKTQITAQTIFGLIGLFGEDDVNATADMIRNATNGEASTYIGWLNKIAVDAEANLSRINSANSEALDAFSTTLIRDANQIKTDTDTLKGQADGFCGRAEAAAEAAEGLLEDIQREKASTAQAAKDAITADVLNGYHIAVSTTMPTNTSGQKVITFVVEP